MEALSTTTDLPMEQAETAVRAALAADRKSVV